MTSVGLASWIPASWRTLLQTAITDPQFSALADFIDEERRRTTVYPPPEEVFAALRLTPPEAVRAVILGQDPYHGPGQAHGLAFSVRAGARRPPSLRNILAELPGVTAVDGGSLEPWARHGVLLLNTVLTVRQAAAGSHRRRGWESFTDTIIKVVDATPGPVVFLLWGRAARSRASLIDRDRHVVLEAAHPSPFSVPGFRGKAGFLESNDELARRGAEPIDWSLGEGDE
jgi:uracil-DNA glycosylase